MLDLPVLILLILPSCEHYATVMRLTIRALPPVLRNMNHLGFPKWKE